MYVKENLFDLMADTLKYEQLTSKTLLSLSLSLSGKWCGTLWLPF